MQLETDAMVAVVKRLRRAEGQIGGIIRMIEDGRECQDIVNQLAAVSKAIDRAGFATIAVGLKQWVEDGEAGAPDLTAREKMFLSLA